jgi:Bacterial alpha-L-rhamnosidase 6 hairpin glycosidase domain
MASLRRLCLLVGLFMQLCICASPYSSYIYTPSKRKILPAKVHNVNGTAVNAASLTKPPGSTKISGDSAITFDFGKNVAGIVSFSVSAVSGSENYIGISFTESSLWINSEGCDATADAGLDVALWWKVSANSHYTADKKYQRGGFRYLNVYHNTSGSVELTDLSIYFTAIPQKAESELQDYTGYFHTNDDSLNRVWYAGAYTNQMCTIDPKAGDSLVHLGKVMSNMTITGATITWWNNYTVANGTSVLVDGAKRDRLVWPGDIAISGPSTFVSTNDMDSIKNGLDSLLLLQNSSGALPYAGVPFEKLGLGFSFTYHLYSLIDIHDYYLYTGNKAYLEKNWHAFKLGLNYSLSFIDSTGLQYVTTPNDWLRFGMGGHNIEANAILYYTLGLGLQLADILDDTSVTSKYTKARSGIKSAANARLWDPEMNLYRDNDTKPLTSLHPQDGNCWAIISDLTNSTAQAVNISDALKARWGPYGAPAPEAGPTVSPFISGFELQAHYLAGQPQYAVQLMKLMWADFMLDDPRMTNSTFIEGYSTNGDLHYAPYTNDPRISHAHGWATGPTSTLTFHAAGLRITGVAGSSWAISPSLGGLTEIEAGYQTKLGDFSVKVSGGSNGGMNIDFSTPKGTTGFVSAPHPAAGGTLTVKSKCGEDVVLTLAAGGSGRVEVDDLPGGNYTVVLKVG